MKKLVFKKPKDLKVLLRRLAEYMAPYKIQLFIVFICMIASAYGEVRATYYLKPVINDYIVPAIGTGVVDHSGFLKMIATMAGLFFGGVAASFIQNAIMVRISNSILASIREDMFRKMHSLPLSYFDNHTNGEIISYYSNDIDTLSNMLRQSFPKIIDSIVTLVVILVTMLFVNSILGIIVILCVAGLAVLMKRILANKSRFFSSQQESLSEINAYGEEMITGQREVKAFGQKENIRSQFVQTNEKLFQSSSMANFFSDAMFSMTEGINNIGYTIVVLSGAILTLNGMADVGTIGLFVQYYRKLQTPITGFSKQVNNLMSALAGAERIFTFLDEKPETDEGEVTFVNAKNQNGMLCEEPEFTGYFAWKTANGNLIPCKGELEFIHVDFGYTEGRTILHDINLKIPSGARVAFVGTTGAGKTTVINLLTRLYEIQSGDILFDGISVKNIRKDSLRNAADMVLQDIHLFNGTVEDNIRLGRMNATEKEVQDAAHLANADYFIQKLDHSYQSQVHYDGSGFSRGESQLLTIARAAIGKKPVMIMDEATSSVDSRTENLITKGIEALFKGKTVLVIAHRLSTIINSDIIVVLDKGRIVEQGSHSELIAARGHYYRMVNSRKESAS